jgi:phage gp45-like
MGRRSSTRIVADRMNNAITYTSVSDTAEDHLFRELQIDLYTDEQQQDIEHIEPYGVTSRVKKPTGEGQGKKSAEAMTVFNNGTRSHGVVLVVGDRRYRLKGLQEGEVSLYDDQGHQVHITRDGIIISAPNSKKIVTQLMTDDQMPPSTSGGQGGQSKQAGRNTDATLTLDKNGYNITHKQKISYTVGNSTLMLEPDKITINSTKISNMASDHFETIGKTILGIDSADEGAPKGETGDVPYKQTYVKLIA